jgi:hypothetical protein
MHNKMNLIRISAEALLSEQGGLLYVIELLEDSQEARTELETSNERISKISKSLTIFQTSFTIGAWFPSIYG